MKGKLLGSAPTLEAINGLISRFFYGTEIELKPSGPKTWEVHNSSGPLDFVIVRQKGQRFRFEKTETTA